MFDGISPIGTRLSIPEHIDEDEPHFTAAELSATPGRVLEYYQKQGFVVIRGLIPTALCTLVRTAFDKDVRRSRTPILRQKNMRYERNVMDTDGFLTNPIFNVQDLGSGSLDGFRRSVLDVLTHRGIADATAVMLGAAPTKVVQSMFFEAPAGTWAHQDSYYQDSASGLGGGIAGWFALEDIDAGAGRFYVCPGSHRGAFSLRNAGSHNFATGHAAYQKAVLAMIREQGLSIVAPALNAGDVLLWNSLTVHGSLPAGRPGVSRASLTAHFMRRDDEMLQFHSRIRKQRTTTHNGMVVALLHDQNLFHNRIVRDAAFRFPVPYGLLRRAALRAVLAGLHLRNKASMEGRRA